MNNFLFIIILLFNLTVYGQDTIRQFNTNDSSKLIKEYIIDNETQKPNGFFKEYDRNGELKTHIEYKNGLMWNIFLVKDKNNHQIIDFGTFKDGNGTIKSFKDKDIISSVREYKNGVLNGLSIKYHNNGEVSMKGNYYNGNRCGTWYRYNNDGTQKENEEKEFGKKCLN